MSRIARLLVGLVLATAAAFWSLQLERTRLWAAVPDGVGTNVKRQLLDSLRQRTTEGRVRPGSYVHLLHLVGAARNHLDVYVAEGNLTE